MLNKKEIGFTKKLIQKHLSAKKTYHNDIKKIRVSIADPPYDWEEVYEALDSMLKIETTMGKKVQSFEKLFDDKEMMATSLDKIGLIYRKRGEYNKALELDSNLWIAYMNRGRSYYRLEQFDFAKSDYDKAIEINPKNDKLKLWRNEIPSNY